MNKEDFVTYETAVKLKELGFDWECAAYYHSGFSDEDDVSFYKCNFIDNHNHRSNPRIYSAPTMAKAQKWLREVHGIHVEPRFVYNGLFDLFIVSENRQLHKHFINMRWISYESALEAGIDAALKLIEQNKS